MKAKVLNGLPCTPQLLTNISLLDKILERGAELQEDVLLNIGDSITIDLHCFLS